MFVFTTVKIAKNDDMCNQIEHHFITIFIT